MIMEGTKEVDKVGDKEGVGPATGDGLELDRANRYAPGDKAWWSGEKQGGNRGRVFSGAF